MFSLFSQQFNHNIHRHLTPEERTLLLGHANEIPNYHVFETSAELFETLANKQIFNRIKRRRAKRSSDNVGGDSDQERVLNTLKVEFKAFDRHFQLKLWPNHHLLSPKFRLANELVEKMSEELAVTNQSRSDGYKKANNAEKTNTTRTTLLMMIADEIEHCFYQGVVEGEAESAVALSLCNGMVSFM